MLSISEEIIKVSDKINNLLINLGHESNYNSRCSDRYILTLMVLKIFWTIKSDKHFHRLIKEKLIEEILFESRDNFFIIDTKPIPLVEISRANSSIIVKLFYRWSLPDRY